MTAKTLMIQGSNSSVGKSLLVTALCRIYARRGIRVAPFKAQNISNNAAVCADGSEIGRSQALQAVAADLAPTVEMNPILIKAEADSRPQTILMGRVWQPHQSQSYSERKDYLWQQVTGALDRLRNAHDLVIIEGAGSPAELNLKAGDMVNMAVARYSQSPVLLMGTIDRGGIFAQLLGTLWLLDPDERALVRGLVVNKFRGDPTLFVNGIQILEQRAEIPVLGVIPYLEDLNLPQEDSVSLDPHDFTAQPASPPQIDIAILRLPHISNFDDFDSLKAEAGVAVRYVGSPDEMGHPTALIIPGSKSTMADLEWLRQNGLADAITHFAQAGGPVVGICGGYQLLGKSIYDPFQVESHVDHLDGLGLLPITTHFHKRKSTFQAQAHIRSRQGWLSRLDKSPIVGYEIHSGVTQSQSPWLEITARNGESSHAPDGAISADGTIWGCYLHGLFANDSFRHCWLESLGWTPDQPRTSYMESFYQSLDVLADAVEDALNMDLLDAIINQSYI